MFPPFLFVRPLHAAVRSSAGKVWKRRERSVNRFDACSGVQVDVHLQEAGLVVRIAVEQTGENLLGAISSFIDKLELTTAEPMAPLRRVGLLFALGLAASLFLQPLLAIVWQLIFDTSATRDLSRHFGEQTLRGNPGVILLIAAIGPVIEEFIFRWGAFKLLRFLRFGVVPTILISSIAFGAAHLHIAPVNMAFATLMGIALGWIYAKTEDIWCPIALHAGINAGALVLMGFAVASGWL